MKTMMNGLKFCLAAAVVVASLSVAADADAQQRQRELELEVGTQQSISADGVRSYSEGVRGIAAVRLTGDQSQFVILGERAGQTSLLLIMRDGSQIQYRVTVTDPNATEETGGVDPSAVNERENIRLDLYFVEINDSYNHSVGIGWPGSIGTGTAELDYSLANPGSISATEFSLNAQALLPRLDLAQSNGWVRIYRQGAIVTANGTEARFSAGGEVNVQVQGALSGQVQKIEFGTEIQCLPRYDSETGRIELRITANVSDLSDDRGTGVPGRVTSELNTLVNLQLGQSIVLGGLIARTESRTRAGLPGLSQIPVLGALFGVHSRRYEETEALVFIVPSVVDGVSLAQRNRIEEAIRVYEEFRGGVDETEILEQPRIQRTGN